MHRGRRHTAADVINSCIVSKRNTLGWIAVGLVAVTAIAIALRFARNTPAGPANAWNSSAIQSKLAGIRVKEIDPAHAAVVFFYDLDNRTDTDYRLSSGPNVVIMSRLEPSGSLSSDQQINLDANAFVPAKNRTRIGIEMSRAFAWPVTRDASAERQFRQLVADQVAGLEGFVLFDQTTRYEIDLAAASPEMQVEPATTSAAN